MTRKDYKALAAILNMVWVADLDSYPQIRLIALRMSDVFAADNPRFDADRFMAAVFSRRTGADNE
jgi:hypothetical protein